MPAGLDIVVASDVSWYHTVAVTVCSGSLHCKVLFLWPIKRIRYQQFIFRCCSNWQTFLCTVCLDFHSWPIWSLFTSVGQKQEVKVEQQLRYVLKQIFTDAHQPHLWFDKGVELWWRGNCWRSTMQLWVFVVCLEWSKVGDSEVSQDIIVTRQNVSCNASPDSPKMVHVHKVLLSTYNKYIQ